MARGEEGLSGHKAPSPSPAPASPRFLPAEAVRLPVFIAVRPLLPTRGSFTCAYYAFPFKLYAPWHVIVSNIRHGLAAVSSAIARRDKDPFAPPSATAAIFFLQARNGLTLSVCRNRISNRSGNPPTYARNALPLGERFSIRQIAFKVRRMSESRKPDAYREAVASSQSKAIRLDDR